MDTVKTLIVIYLAAINAAALIVCAADKLAAKKGAYRVPEAVLLLLSAAGGGAGMLFGMYIFNHKTRKPKFFIGVPAIIMMEIALCSYLYYRGVL